MPTPEMRLRAALYQRPPRRPRAGLAHQQHDCDDHAVDDDHRAQRVPAEAPRDADAEVAAGERTAAGSQRTGPKNANQTTATALMISELMPFKAFSRWIPSSMRTTNTASVMIPSAAPKYAP